MKFTSHFDESGQAYWLVEVRIRERILLAEGLSFIEAVHNAIDLISDSHHVTLPYLGVANV